MITGSQSGGAIVEVQHVLPDHRMRTEDDQAQNINKARR